VISETDESTTFYYCKIRQRGVGDGLGVRTLPFHRRLEESEVGFRYLVPNPQPLRIVAYFGGITKWLRKSDWNDRNTL
jgi:hypothetical protein